MAWRHRQCLTRIFGERPISLLGLMSLTFRIRPDLVRGSPFAVDAG
ncbi:hypothetical protein I553_4176 [Mycobacterium xenopi 4042]|uniref:Uncharacterized protein n=1 Tax=Mycobacterium xenopi 4042 TaxID=1299334 RepID=X8ADA5_MYCXE|nr:hypothetical protein I553_4176 [Mycobacterium xenopi 4042]EUA50618.1 hypothetical protein I552_1556 [Mycobacterium xenopi 3993]